MVGSFTSKANAEDRAAELKKMGMKPEIVTAQISGKTWYRVRVEAFSSRPPADTLLNKMEKAGYDDAFIVIENGKAADNQGQSGTSFEVMVGSFTSKANAEDRAAELKKMGMKPEIVTAQISGKTWYRVRVGAFSSRPPADTLLNKMEKAGYDDAFIVIDSGSSVTQKSSQSGKTAGAGSSTPGSGNASGNANKSTGTGSSSQPSSDGSESSRDTGSDSSNNNPVIDPVNGNPSGFTILGPTFLSPEHMNRFVKTINPKAPDLGSYYLIFGDYYGIRGDVAFAQAILETDYFRFTGDVKPDQNNFAGLGATGSKVRGASFVTQEEGVLAQLQHLFAYATTNKLPSQYPLVDPRFDLVDRGSAPTWYALNGKWAVPGRDYGQNIIDIYERMIHTTIQHLETTRQNLNS
ncbi:SPOR domain-containing protein [Neobacillus mesonae]|nr:SPOR domain-containing protein [Neobacillus mesonae]